MCFAKMLEESTIVQKAFAANPAHHWWACYWQRQVIDRPFSTVLEPRPVRRHPICCQFNIITTEMLWQVLLSSEATNICQQSKYRSKQHRKALGNGRVHYEQMAVQSASGQTMLRQADGVEGQIIDEVANDSVEQAVQHCLIFFALLGDAQSLDHPHVLHSA